MPKRKRSDEGVAEIVSDPNCIAQGLIPDVGTETHQRRPEEEPSTSGNTVPAAAVQGGGELQSADVAAEELLSGHPFWSLLIQAGYTWV